MGIFQLLKYTSIKGKNFIKTTFHESKNIIDNIFTTKPKVSSNVSRHLTKGITSGREECMPIDFSDLEEGIKKIKFKKAKTIEEARAYAQQELGISRFNFTDLEMANQFNLSTTRAFNKTGCRELIPDEAVIVKLSDMKFLSNMNKEEFATIPAATLHLKDGGKRVVFSLDYLEQLDDTIKKGIESFKNFGQVTKDKNGFEQINLMFDYQYKHTLNRYFKLYQQGKLTPKAKVDFQSLLDVVIDEQKTILSSKSNLLRTGRPRRAVGMDKWVLHEEGHVLYSKISGNIKSGQKFLNDEERSIIHQGISSYAAESPEEMMAEKIAESLSGASFPGKIEIIFEKYFDNKFLIENSVNAETKSFLCRTFGLNPSLMGEEKIKQLDELVELMNSNTQKVQSLKISKSG